MSRPSDRLWLPDSARPNAITDPATGARVVPVGGEQLDRIVGPGSSVFLTPTSFGYWTLEGDTYGRERQPAVHIEFEHLRQQIIDGTANVDYHGITAGMGTSIHDFVEFPDGPRLCVAMKNDGVTYIIGPIAGVCPAGWYESLMDGFALLFGALPGQTKLPFLSTGPMRVGELAVWKDAPKADDPTEPPGRNQPCPCGSGLKFKRCCGA